MLDQNWLESRHELRNCWNMLWDKHRKLEVEATGAQMKDCQYPCTYVRKLTMVGYQKHHNDSSLQLKMITIGQKS